MRVSVGTERSLYICSTRWESLLSSQPMISFQIGQSQVASLTRLALAGNFNLNSVA